MHFSKFFFIFIILVNISFANVVKIVYNAGTPPLKFSDSNDNATGMLIDIWKLWAQKNNLEIEFIKTSWDESLEMIKDGRADIHAGLYFTKDRDEFLDYTTNPLYENKNYFFYEKSISQINSNDDLKPFIVGVGNGFPRTFMKENYPEIITREYDTNEETIDALKKGEIKVLLNALPTFIYSLKINKIDTDKFKYLENKPAFTKLYYGAVKEGNQKLLNIINNGFKKISENELKNIELKWTKNFVDVEFESSDNLLNLTKEEQLFIKNNKVIVGGESDWAPFDFVEDGKYKGISKDIIDLISKKTGLKLEYKINLTWTELVDEFKAGKIDILPALYKDKQREEYTNFTNSYFEIKDYVFAKNGLNINSIEDLATKRVAIIDGYTIIKKLENKFPNINIIKVKSLKDGLDAVLLDKADLYIDGYAIVTYTLTKNMINEIKPIFPIEFYTNNLRIGIQKKQPILTSIINKGMNAISDKELRDITLYWLKQHDEVSNIEFTKNEALWLDKKIPIKYAYDTDWAPFEWKDDIDNHTGIIADIINIISKKSGIKFVADNGVKNWNEALKAAKDRKVDMLSGTGVNEEKLKYLAFTNKNIYTVPYVIVSRIDDNSDYTDGLNSKEKRVFGLIKGHSLVEKIQNNFKNLSMTLVSDTKDGFDKLVNKEIDAFIINQAAGNYFIKSLGYEDTRISSKLDEHLELKIAIRNDWPQEVISILDKTLQEITDEELHTIFTKWTNKKITKETDWEVVFELLGVAFIIFLVFYLNNKNLKSMVKKKTKELEKLLSQFDKNVIASRTDLKGNIIYVSKAFCEISGFSQEELIGKSQSIVRHPETPSKLFKELWQTIQSGKTWRGEIKNKKKDGGFYWVDAIITPEFDDNNIIIGYSAIREDITAKKEVEELSKNLEQKVEERTLELKEQEQFLDSLLDSQEQIVITTDGKTLRSANKKFLDFFNISNIDEFKKDFDCICDRFVLDESGTYLQKYMGEISWIEYVLQNSNKTNRAVILKDNKERIFSVTAAVMPIEDGTIKSAVFTNITELESQKKQTETILSSVLLPMLITSKKTRKIVYANSFAEEQYETTLDELIGLDIEAFYTHETQRDEILNELQTNGKLQNFETKFKTLKGKEFDAILSLVDITFAEEDCFLGVASDITKQKELQKEIQAIHKHTRESIEYASLIQHALIPSNDMFRKYFSDYLTIWHPKDIVGGDIYLFEELRNDNECLLMAIDCTGHGVPGAFVTMLVKAIERQITSNIINSDEVVSPAKILSIFNRSMKHLLKQEDDESISNAGFDGGIIYYNKKEKIIKYSGAETPLFYIEDGELKTIKGSRHSVGYKKSDANFEFKEHTINVKEGMQFYLTTDGYLDQNGGEKGFPFGKKRFSSILEENYSLPFADQQEILLYDMQEYQGKEEKNDDMTIIGIKI